MRYLLVIILMLATTGAAVAQNEFDFEQALRMTDREFVRNNWFDERITKLYSEDEEDREYALDGFLRFRPEADEHFDRVLELFLHDPSEDVRRASIGPLLALAPDPAEYIEPLLVSMAEASPKMRRRILYELPKYGPVRTELSGYLVDELHRGDDETATNIGKALHMACPQVIPREVIEQLGLLRTGTDGEKLQAIKILMRIGPYPAAPDPLSQNLQDEGYIDLEFRGKMRWSFYGPGGNALSFGTDWITELDQPWTDVLAVTASILKHTADNELQITAIGLIERCGEPAQAHAGLLIRLLDHPDTELRVAAVHALAVLRPPGQAVMQALIDALDDDEAAVVAMSVAAITRQAAGREQALPYVLELAENPPSQPNSDVRYWENSWDGEASLPVEVANYLASLGDQAQPAVPTILTHMQYGGPDYTFLNCLGDIGPAASAAIPYLTELGHAERTVAQSAAIALAKIDPSAESAAPALLASIKASESANGHRPVMSQLDALSYLGHLDYRTIDYVCFLARESNTKLNVSGSLCIGNALANCGKDSWIVIPTLCDILETDYNSDAFYAGLALVVNGKEHPELVPRILAELEKRGLLADHRGGLVAGYLVEDDDLAVQYLRQALFVQYEEQWPANALHAMGRRGDASRAAIPDLMQMMDHPETGVWLNAAFVLLKHEPEVLTEYLPQITEQVYSGWDTYLKNSIWILGEMGPLAQSAIPALEIRSHDIDPDVRIRAAIAIAKIRGEWD